MENGNQKQRVKYHLNSDFPRALVLLRKERGYSQRMVAEDLGISQGLLSHYERGVRECGLDFLVRAADYYGVSCDYLLGRTSGETTLVFTGGRKKTDWGSLLREAYT